MGMSTVRRAFIRGLWGDVWKHRNGKIQKEILETKERDWFTIFTFGHENHKWLEDNGFNSICVNTFPTMWDLETEMYRHKLEIFHIAFNYFDEIAFLDWDCVPTDKFDYVWDELGKKESFQANLFQYRTKKCLWRETDLRKVCNGGFAYFRDDSIPEKMIDIWDGLHKWVDEKQAERQKRGLELRFREKSLIFDDEPAMSKYIDDFCGGWCGSEVYWNLFEPEVCNLRRKSVYSQTMLDGKKSCFLHLL